MATNDCKFKVTKLDPKCSTMKVTVYITKEFKIRLWIAAKLFRLAAGILGCKTDIEIGES